jgi:hypothetical protein
MVTSLVNSETTDRAYGLGPLDFASISVDVVGTIFTVALVYYGVKRLKLFKRNAQPELRPTFH